MPREMNILALAKGEERYVFLYDDESTSTLLDVFDRFALNPDLAFSDGDAAILSQKVRDTASAAHCRSLFAPRI